MDIFKSDDAVLQPYLDKMREQLYNLSPTEQSTFMEQIEKLKRLTRDEQNAQLAEAIKDPKKAQLVAEILIAKGYLSPNWRNETEEINDN